MANPNIWAPGESISANSSVAVERFVATAGQTLFTLTAFTYSVGTSSLYVYVNGGFQVVAVDFTETSSSSFTLSEAVTEGSIVAAVGFLEIAGGSSVVDAAVVAAQAAKAAAELAETSAEASAVVAAAYANNLPNATTAGVSKYIKTNATSDGWEYKTAADVLEDIVPELHAATEKTTPAVNDELALADSDESFSLKKLKWSSLVTAITSTLSAQGKLREDVSAKDFGAVGDGVTDDTYAMLAFAAASAGRKFIPPGRYKITQMISFQPGDVVEGAGASSVIDASAAGTWPYAAVVRVAGALTQIADLAINAVIGEDVITLTSAAGVSVGDALIVYNPTAKSWSTWRDGYKAGEFVRVHSISGANVRTMNSLYDSYTTTEVDVYRLDGASTVFRDFTVLAPALEIVGVQMSCIDRPVMQNVWSTGALGTSLEFERCMDIRFDGVAYQTQTPTGDEYGVAIANCHGGAITAPSLYGGRHALAIGGYPYVGSVTNRAITVQVGAMGNRAPIGAQDMHGNCEDLRFIGGTFQNGGTVAGKNHKYIGCRFVGKLNGGGIALYAGEVVSGTFEFANCTFESLANPNTLGSGVLELGNLTTNAGACKFVFNQCRYKAPSATAYVIALRLDGVVAAPTLIVDGVDLEATGCTQFIRLTRTSGAAAIARVALTNIYGLPAAADYCVNAGTGLSVTRYTMPSQYGTISVAGVTGSNNANGVATFPHPYPTAPQVIAHKIGTTIGSTVYVPDTANVTTNAATLNATTASGGNYANTNTGTIGWRAVLDQH